MNINILNNAIVTCFLVLINKYMSRFDKNVKILL